MDNYKWNPDAWREYLNLVAQNKINIVEKIINLIEGILKNGALKGIRKPERLKQTAPLILYSRLLVQFLIYPCLKVTPTSPIGCFQDFTIFPCESTLQVPHSKQPKWLKLNFPSIYL